MCLSCVININENSVFLIYLDLALNIERMLFVRILNSCNGFQDHKVGYLQDEGSIITFMYFNAWNFNTFIDATNGV